MSDENRTVPDGEYPAIGMDGVLFFSTPSTGPMQVRLPNMIALGPGTAIVRDGLFAGFQATVKEPPDPKLYEPDDSFRASMP